MCLSSGKACVDSCNCALCGHSMYAKVGNGSLVFQKVPLKSALKWLSILPGMTTDWSCDLLPQEYAELNSIYSRELPSGWEDALPTFTPEDKPLATRLHSQTMLNALANVLPGD